jgi:hypothetical protein
MHQINLRKAASEIQRIGEEKDWDIAATQKSFFESEIPTYPSHAFRMGIVLQEELHVLFLPGPDEKLAAAIVLHRDPIKREKTGFILVEHARPAYEEKTFADLPKVLARFGTQ